MSAREELLELVADTVRAAHLARTLGKSDVAEPIELAQRAMLLTLELDSEQVDVEAVLALAVAEGRPFVDRLLESLRKMEAGG